MQLKKSMYILKLIIAFSLTILSSSSQAVVAQEFERETWDGSSFRSPRIQQPRRESLPSELSGQDLKLTINSSWVGGVDGGYWPIRIKLINRGPDAVLTFRATPINKYTDARIDGAVVTKKCDARQNIESNQLLLIPMVAEDMVFRLEVLKDGKPVKELETIQELGLAHRSYADYMVVTIAHIGLAPRDTRVLEKYGEDFGFYVIAGHISVVGLPSNWLAFSAIDVIVISEEDWENNLDEQQRRAVLDWTRSGRTLIVHQVKNFSAESSEHLDKLLNLDKTSAASDKWHPPIKLLADEFSPLTTVQAVERFRPEHVRISQRRSGERAINGRLESRKKTSVRAASPSVATARDDSSMKESSLEDSSQVDVSRDDPVLNSSATRGYYFGQIFATQNDFFDSSGYQQSVVNADIDLRSRSWIGVNGFTSRSGGLDFYDFVMQNIRVIPTFAYILLITIFCLIIGPANYAYFYFKKRITMLVWTIPLIALLGTLLLITYTSLSSGFTPRTRLRSVTVLDQQQQTAVSSTRVGCFPGRSPANGMTFDPETSFMPIWPVASTPVYGTVDWTDSQHLDRSWLPARIRTQFQLQNIRNERGRVTFVESGSNGKFVNGLEWAINMAIVCDENGDVFYVENVEPGKSVPFQPLTKARAQAFQKIIEDQKLESPVDYGDLDPAAANPYYGRREATWRPTNYSSNVAEQQLGWIKRSDFTKTPLKPNSYIALLNENPGINVGLENHYTTDELHVLFGFF